MNKLLQADAVPVLEYGDQTTAHGFGLKRKPVELDQRTAHRLLTHDVLAGPQRLIRDFRMHMRREAYVNEVDIVAADRVLNGPERRGLRCLRGQRTRAVNVRIADQPHVVQVW